MEKVKLQIELNNRSYDENLLYVAVSLRGGYAIRNYILDGVTHFISNHAFFNVLFNYYKLTNDIEGLHFDVQRAVSTLTFYEKKDDLIHTLNEVLYSIFNHEYNSEIFESAKNKAKAEFSLRYKDGAFRAKYKGIEFSDLNKRFLLKNLIEDIENITYEVFETCAKSLLVPGNVCIYILGETNELDFSTISLEDFDDQFCHTVRIAGYGFDPYLRREAHVIKLARENYNLIIETFDFFNTDTTNFAKQLIVETYAELISTFEPECWVDSLDSSIVFSSEQLHSYKNYLSFESEERYEVVHRRLLAKYVMLLENYPEHFAIKAANFMTVGIYIDQYLDFLSKCSYEVFKEICEKADCKITEGQIVLRKGSK